MKEQMNKQMLDADEVILLEFDVLREDIRDLLHLTLTSKRIFFDQVKKKGILIKSETAETVDVIRLDHIKVYDEKIQAKNIGEKVQMQTIEKNIVIEFNNKKDASKFVAKVVDAATGTTMIKRGVSKVKEAIRTVDDVLGDGPTATILKTGMEVAMTFAPLPGGKKKTTKKVAKAATTVASAIIGKKK